MRSVRMVICYHLTEVIGYVISNWIVTCILIILSKNPIWLHTQTKRFIFIKHCLTFELMVSKGFQKKIPMLEKNENV